MPALTTALLHTLVPDWSDWPVFIETGTCHCQTILAMEPLFDELHTIELGEELWRAAWRRHAGRKIRFHLGDSATKLAEILPCLSRLAISFLDGHWSCGGTARGAIDVPLYEELRQVCVSFFPPAVVIIDDLRLFGQGPHTGEPVDWSHINIDDVDRITRRRRISLEKRADHDKLVLRFSESRDAS